jgi:F420-dependent oxidoreductase-like protein
VKVATPLNAGRISTAVREIVRAEEAGLDRVVVAEAYGFDAISRLGFLAASTTTVELATGIVNVFARSPATLAMTAAGLDDVSDGRFVLGLGASGPGVVEGLHGIPFRNPLGRSRAVIDACRQLWEGQRLVIQGGGISVPLPGTDQNRELRPLKLLDTPIRREIPVGLAAMGPRTVQLAAEICEEWNAIFFLPSRAHRAFEEGLEAGRRLRDPTRRALGIVVDAPLLISDDPVVVQRGMERVRRQIAFYVGGMGPRGQNFYHDLLVRYGFAPEAELVAEAFASGHAERAAHLVPTELAAGCSLVGSRREVMGRLVALETAGVTVINASPLGDGPFDRLAQLTEVIGLVRTLQTA